MSRLDQLEQRIADLEADMDVQRGRPGFRESIAGRQHYLDAPVPPRDNYYGPYGHGSQDR